MFVRAFSFLFLVAASLASSVPALPSQGERNLGDMLVIDVDAMRSDWTEVDIGTKMGFPPGSIVLGKGEDGDLEVTVDQSKMEGRRILSDEEHDQRRLNPNDVVVGFDVVAAGFRHVVTITINFIDRYCGYTGYYQHVVPTPGPILPFDLYVTPAAPNDDNGRKCRTHRPGSDCIVLARAAYVVTPNGDSCTNAFRALHQAAVEGEPHFAQWRGNKFDYQGECDLVFVHAPDFGNGVGMDIHVRTKIRYDYSFIETAAIKIGDDVLEVSSFGDYFLNGVLRADLEGATLAGHPITYKQPMDKKSTYDIELGGGNILAVSSMKDIVSIRFILGQNTEGTDLVFEWFGNSSGMIGSLDSSAMLARDGVTAIEDANAFGAEWQVQGSDPKLFQVLDRAPQYPEKCHLPSPDAYKTNRRLGATISKEAATKACADWPEDQKEDCINDVIAMHDLEFAQAGSY